MSIRDRCLFSSSNIGVILVVLVISTPACLKLEYTAQEQAIDNNGAKMLSEAAAANLKAGDRSDLNRKLEQSFRQGVTEKAFHSMVDHMERDYGKVIDYQFKQEEFGQKLYPDGSTKPMRKFWYAASTTKFEKGSHFLTFEVVRDGDSLALSSFAIVRFTGDIPGHLR